MPCHLIILIGLVSLALPGCFGQAPSLQLAARVKYQRAIEDVYWQQRTWPNENEAKPPLVAVISPKQVQAEAEEPLRLSNALAELCGQPISGAALQAEISRMAVSSRKPDVRRRLFAVLDNDPRIITEMLARPMLAERRARSSYEHVRASVPVPADT